MPSHCVLCLASSAFTTRPRMPRRKHEGTPFIIVSALSIATLVKGPFVAPMQRAVALRSYYHSLRIRMVLIDSLLPLRAVLEPRWRGRARARTQPRPLAAGRWGV